MNFWMYSFSSNLENFPKGYFLHLSLSPFGGPSTDMLYAWYFPQISEALVPFSSLVFQTESYLLVSLNSLIIFIGTLRLLLKPSSEFFISGIIFFKSRISIWFFFNFLLWNNLDLQKSCKDSTESSCICFTQLSLMLMSYINMVQYVKSKKLTLVQNYSLRSDFIGFPTNLSFFWSRIQMRDYCIQSSCLLDLLWFVTDSQFFLDFHDLDRFFKSTGQVLLQSGPKFHFACFLFFKISLRL